MNRAHGYKNRGTAFYDVQEQECVSEGGYRVTSGGLSKNWPPVFFVGIRVFYSEIDPCQGSTLQQ